MICEPQIATLTEIETYWTINDLFDAHEILDMRDEIKEDQAKEQERLSRGKNK